MKFISSFVILILSLSSAKIIPPNDHQNWNVLQDDHIWVGWTDHSGFQWGKSRTTLPYSLQNIASLLEDKGNYTEVFKRVTVSQVLEENVVYLVLDMPFPFSSRDYIVKYTQLNENGDHVYQFHSVNSNIISLNENNVRLLHAAGEWRLTPQKNNETMVTYTWNGELLGDFPDWALTRAWTTQGHEVLQWLEEALQKQ